MKVKEFCEKYIACKNDNAKKALTKSVIKEDYVPFMAKVANARQVIINSFNKGDGKREYCTPVYYLNNVISTLGMYTTLDLTPGDEGVLMSNADTYDMLNACGALTDILNAVPGKERAEFQTICDMEKSDFERNFMSITSYIEDACGAITEIVNSNK